MFLSVKSDGAHRIHRGLLEAVNLDGKIKNIYHKEYTEYVPHITLGDLRSNISVEVLNSIKKKADEVLINIPKFEVSFVRIYVKHSPEESYIKLLDVFLEK